ncbi:MAG TPA: hypothetical protein VF508_07540 [Pyrinomonadaceae bacterium]|jgi:hypothetical protein
MSGPKDVEERIERMMHAWQTLAPDKRFGGMSLADFETATEASRDTRRLIETLEDQLAEQITARERADANSAARMQLVVAGVLADPTEGPDSALYEALGYTRKSERKTGLTRKRKEPPTQ